MKKGFTLLELLIVITILAILAGAMMPIFSTSRSTAESAKAKADLDAIKSSAIMLHYDASAWPVDANNGSCFITNDTGCVNSTAGGSWKGPYMASWEDDPWGQFYRVWNASGNNSLYAVSNGSNKVFDNCDPNNDTCILITANRTK